MHNMQNRGHSFKLLKPFLSTILVITEEQSNIVEQHSVAILCTVIKCGKTGVKLITHLQVSRNTSFK